MKEQHEQYTENILDLIVSDPLPASKLNLSHFPFWILGSDCLQPHSATFWLYLGIAPVLTLHVASQEMHLILLCSSRDNSGIYSSIPHMLFECTPHVRLCARSWRYTGGNTHMALTLKEFAVSLEGREGKKPVVTKIITLRMFPVL